MTHGELALVVFVFALIYGALVLPRLAERFGKRLAQTPTRDKPKK